MTTTKDDIRSGSGRAFVLASLYAEAMCNRHADLYIQWFCCSHPFRDKVCANLRRRCLTERVGCSAFKDKTVQ
jgi:hypothetical protein